MLLRVGFVVNRQRGSHIILRRGSPYARVVVPDHKRVRPGTLRQIPTEAGLTVERLLELRSPALASVSQSFRNTCENLRNRAHCAGYQETLRAEPLFTS